MLSTDFRFKLKAEPDDGFIKNAYTHHRDRVKNE